MRNDDAYAGRPGTAPGAHARALVEQRGVGDGPTVVDAADAGVAVRLRSRAGSRYGNQP